MIEEAGSFTMPAMFIHHKNYCKIIKQEAILKGEFTLSSGAKSDTYFDMRRVSLSAEGVSHMVWGIHKLISNSKEPINAIGGPTLGADPIVGAYLCYAWETYQTVLEGFLVRKEKKTHGTCRRIEGPNLKGKLCVVIEDVTTTGKSAMDAVAAVEEEGGKVYGVISMFDRQEGAEELFKGKCQFASLARLADIQV